MINCYVVGKFLLRSGHDIALTIIEEVFSARQIIV